MTHGDDFESIVDLTEDRSIVAHAQPVATAPLASEGFCVSAGGLSEPCDRFQNSERRWPIDGASCAFASKVKGKRSP
jgi:hypothetical protein